MVSFVRKKVDAIKRTINREYNRNKYFRYFFWLSVVFVFATPLMSFEPVVTLLQSLGWFDVIDAVIGIGFMIMFYVGFFLLVWLGIKRLFRRGKK